MPLKQVLLASVVLVSSCVVAQDVYQGKYKGYEFEPEYGVALTEQEWKQHQDGYQSFLREWHGLKAARELSVDDNYILYLQVKLSNTLLFRKRYDEIYKETGIRELSNWEGVIAYGDNLSQLLLKDRELLPVGRGGYDFYGCIDEQPLFKANIMGEQEKQEVFVVTGSGHHTDNMRGAGARDHLKLHVFGGPQYEKLFEVMLMAVNYRPFNPDDPAKDFYFPNSGYSGKKVAIESEAGEGRKLYSKLFLQDFNENDRLDILVWQREYKSRTIAAGIQSGFDLDRSEFTWYEENASGNGFDVKPITTEQADTWLANHKLTWKQGWPNKSLCTEGRARLPMIGGIDDPVLEQ